jgi:hypothetical protein
MNREVNKDLIWTAIREASTMNALKFFGDVLRIHAAYQLPHTADQNFMTECRQAFKLRHAELSEESNEQ